jgi:hypothetical protein
MGILRTNRISGLETPTPVTGSVVFDGSGDLLIVSSSDFAFGTGDCTVEGWGYVTSHINYRVLATTRPTNLGYGDAWHIGCDVNGTLSLYSNAFNLQTASNVVPTNQWFHWAFTRNNGIGRLFVNGTIVASGSVTNNYTRTLLGIGDFPTTQAEPWSGYISNLRILKGTALYTSNFTPPVNELQRIGDTVLLCCNNPDSAGAEATGKTITVNGNAAASTFSPGLTRDFTYGTQFSGVTKFDTQGYFVPPSGTTEQRGRGRGVFGGGYNPSNVNTMDYIQIQSQGIAQDFGDLLNAVNVRGGASCSSSTRGLFAGGYSASLPYTASNIIEYITISSTSNAVDFGDLTVGRERIASTSNSTRGLFAGRGLDPSTVSNIIDYVTIASVGNALDFGDLIEGRSRFSGCSSPTRGVFGGGGNYSTSLNTIDFITISSTGNAVDFGDLLVGRQWISSCSNSIRGLFAGGIVPPTASQNVIEYITIATTGNAIDFGDLTLGRYALSACSSAIRGVFGGGNSVPLQTNTIDYVTISSTGNAQDFGDLSGIRSMLMSCSDSHGGLS